MYFYFKLSLILLTISVSTSLFGNSKYGDPIQVGFQRVLNSNYLNTPQSIKIYLPDSYSSSPTKHYPVVYIIAGQRYFLNGISYQQSLKFSDSPNDWFDHTPEFIVIGIDTFSRQRAQIFRKQSDQFISFVEKELIPYIEHTFRTTGEKTIFAWELAAGMVVNVLADNPKLFDHYILSSPVPIAQTNLVKIENQLKTGAYANKLIYMSLSPIETWVKEGLDSLDQLFSANDQSNLSWKYETHKGEGHYSTANLSLYSGLRFVFNDYAPVRFHSLTQFKQSGGLPGLIRRYENRGKRYQIDERVHGFSQHYLFLLAKRENDYELFTKLMKQFPNYFTNFSALNNANWYISYSDFLVGHNDIHQAKNVLTLGAQRLPNSPKLKTALNNLL